MKTQEPLIYEISSPGRCGVDMPQPDVPETAIPAELCRANWACRNCRNWTWCATT